MFDYIKKDIDFQVKTIIYDARYYVATLDEIRNAIESLEDLKEHIEKRIKELKKVESLLEEERRKKQGIFTEEEIEDVISSIEKEVGYED